MIASEPPTDREFLYTHRDFERVRVLVHRMAGISLSDKKQDLVYSRLARRLRATNATDFATYLSALEEDDDEREYFINALTTNLTAFFRERHHFDALTQFAKTFEQKRRLRIWSCAASTGEEPYSIAITLAELYENVQERAEIIGSDVNTTVLDCARRGVYDASQLKDINPDQIKKNFKGGVGKNEGLVKVQSNIANAVQFKHINLIAKSLPLTGPFDVIFCRNVLIYFDKPTQLMILERLHSLLGPNSLLMTGHSENLFRAQHLFRAVGSTTYVKASLAFERA